MLDEELLSWYTFTFFHVYSSWYLHLQRFGRYTLRSSTGQIYLIPLFTGLYCYHSIFFSCYGDMTYQQKLSTVFFLLCRLLRTTTCTNLSFLSGISENIQRFVVCIIAGPYSKPVPPFRDISPLLNTFARREHDLELCVFNPMQLWQDTEETGDPFPSQGGRTSKGYSSGRDTDIRYSWSSMEMKQLINSGIMSDWRVRRIKESAPTLGSEKLSSWHTIELNTMRKALICKERLLWKIYHLRIDIRFNALKLLHLIVHDRQDLMGVF